jgi:tetratricopeptide (TPR) repeat protein
VAIEAGRKVAANVRLEQIEQFPTVEFFQTVPLLSLVRFARWEEILNEQRPPEQLKFSRAIWHYARSVAFTRTGNLEAAEAELAAMIPLLANESIWFLDGNDYPASQILSIAEFLGKGEIALAREDFSTAIEHFSNAVEGQETLPYTEPPFWYYPTRQSLGHALLLADESAQAESVFRDDLKQYPRNGWSLLGLSLSLEGQGKNAEAAKFRDRFEKIWERSDVQLKSSVL